MGKPDKNTNRRPWLMPLAVIVLLSVSGLGALRLSVSQNVMDMLPDDDAQVTDARFVIEHFPASERILIALHSDDSAKLVPAATELAERVRKIDSITHVQDQIDQNSLRELYQDYMNHLPELFGPDMQQGYEQRLTLDNLNQNMQHRLDAAAGSDGPASFDTFRSDPFNFGEVLIARFDQLAGGYQGGLRENHIVSQDGKVTLIFCEAGFSAGDTDKGEVLMSALDDAFSKLPNGVTAHVIGAHRSSVDNARVVKSDLQWTITGSVLAILILFLLVFRSLVPVLIAGLSAGSGLLVAVGAFGWMNVELTAITLGMAAALLGITVDYTIHLCAAYFGSTDIEDSQAAANRSLREVAGPSGVAMLTTALALLLLMFSNFKGMESLAKLSSVSIAVAFAITMLIGPLLLRTLKARAGSRQKSLRRIGSLAGAARASGWPVLVGAAVVLVAAGYGLPQLEFEGDTTKLDAKSSATGESEALLYASFGDAISGRTIMVAEGDTLLDSLATTEAFQNHQRISDFRGLSLLLPSLPAQSRNRSAWRAFFNADKISEIKKIMLQASAVNPSTGKTITFNEARVEAGFADFIAMLEADDRTAIDASSVLNSTGGDMLRQFVLERDGRVYVTSTASSSFAPKYFDGKPIANGHVLLKRNLAVHMVDLIRNDVLKLGLLALLLVTLIVAIKFKNLRLTAAALAPVIGGLVFTLGMMGWFSMPFNVINVMLMVFVAGLGIDYGIFLVASWQDNSESSPAAAGVTVAALTTIIGFGSLTFARHPALFSVGITATIGVSSALAIALLVVPVLLPLRDEDANNS